MLIQCCGSGPLQGQAPNPSHDPEGQAPNPSHNPEGQAPNPSHDPEGQVPNPLHWFNLQNYKTHRNKQTELQLKRQFM